MSIENFAVTCYDHFLSTPETTHMGRRTDGANAPLITLILTVSCKVTNSRLLATHNNIMTDRLTKITKDSTGLN